ncbi:protein-glutamine gamma-glutamyltransferase 4 isoform X1 [Patella vulgata]|uniref:protein-glutamine gamma-glutamyltransferase 4 isoform X1 n=1 Tax=Patella vulgata TaxID=6465 RepID=UPI0021803A87|nr:protein-glutamine gamma-glutamyltransferase 4 isoform X1 [Patella vulgata]
MHRDKYDLQPPEPKPTMSERFSSAYGNLRSALLGSNLKGRKHGGAVAEGNIFTDEATLTAFKEKKEEGELKPKSVDLVRVSNREAHHTSDYTLPNLIVRRGQEFDITIHFERNYLKSEDEIMLKFVTGARPQQSKGTVIPVVGNETIDPNGWGYKMVLDNGKYVTLRIRSSASAIMGRYQLFIDTVHKRQKDGPEKYRYKHPDDIYILFNPWCKDDLVFIDDEVKRQEYVLNPTGRIWLGSAGKYCVRPWNFAQFDEVCLVAALALLDKSELGDAARSNPILITRAIGKSITANERDAGVMTGNWSGKYDDGVAPYTWNGSSVILEEYLKKRKGVKFGQCWNFSAVATTLLRALGIPTRCVTCFKSAHDSDFSSALDSHWSSENKPKTNMDDGLWDYHVWNESWFKRPDLPSGHDGWQAFDPTPQECNEGVFTCGPASVKAIKEGELYLGYEAKFLFAEVNADRINWEVDREGNMVAFQMDKHIGGRCISTKAAGTISREDITSDYKYKDDSSDAKKVLERASRTTFRCDPAITPFSKDDMEFRFQGDTQKSGDLNVTLKFKNDSSAGRVVDVCIGMVTAFYTGVPCADLKETVNTIVTEPSAEGDCSLLLKCSEFINTQDGDAHVNVYATAKVRETGQRFAARESFWLEKPTLDVKTEGNAEKGKPFDIVVKIVNTLGVPLINGVINAEGPGISRITGVKTKKSIAPGEELRETIKMTGKFVGRVEIIVNFHCKQISDVCGVGLIEIVEPK